MFGSKKHEEPDLTFEEFKAHTKTAIDQRIALARMVATEKASQLGAKVAFLAISFILFVFTLAFLSIAAGLWLAQALNSALKGFGLLAGIYLLLLFIFYFAGKKALVPFIINRIIRSAYNDDDDDDEDEEPLSSDVSHLAGVGDAAVNTTPGTTGNPHHEVPVNPDADNLSAAKAETVRSMHLPEQPVADNEGQYSKKANPTVA